jgi:nucleoid-associated protein YgaU
MQKIERYGVIALVVLLVTILAVSLWGESGWNWKFWEKKDASGEVANAETQRPRLRQRMLQEQARQEGTLPLQTPEPSTVNPAPLGTQPATPIVTPLSTVVTPGATPAPIGGQPLATPNALPVRPIGSQLGGQTPAQPIGGIANAPTTTPQPLGPALQPAAPSGTRSYTVKNGDTLGAIAARELGTSTRWTEIQTLNGNLDPKKLRAGMTLQLPGGKSVASATPANSTARKPAAGGSSYVVKNGDTLSKIAARELGDADRWTEIRDLNPGLEPQKLKVGASLVMPAGASVAKADAGPKAHDEAVGWSPRATKKTAVQ